jgi:ubiquinone/menaquinone biosynthesis C-methylase UbiE
MSQETTTHHDWREAGEAWGNRAADWAYLWEPYARSANRAVFDQLAVAEGTRLLDIACGSGFAAHLASERGATVSGIDASAGLVTIARARTPNGDFRVGDMFALPFPDASFDAATSFNGIWKGCEGALLEARRVLVPGGRLGLTFWGRFEHLGLMPYFLKVIELSEATHAAASMEQGDSQNVMEEMLKATGFERLERGTVTVVNEWPDIEIAVRALVAAGPSVPAIRAVGLDVFCDAVRAVIDPLHVPGVGIRVTSEFEWISARPIDPLQRT